MFTNIDFINIVELINVEFLLLLPATNNGTCANGTCTNNGCSNGNCLNNPCNNNSCSNTKCYD
jgi:hypothetical protein